MAKRHGRTGRRMGNRRPRAAASHPPAEISNPQSAAAASLVNSELRRFPWGDPARRYGLESPYMAVVNARGPWAVWRHGAANPPFIPLCLDLLDKGFWRKADHGQRVFLLTVWLNAAREDDWGIVWGDPVRLCLDWGLDVATFTARLDWMIGTGLGCYLTRAEADAARSWRPYRPNQKSEIKDQKSDREEGGKPEGGGGESGKGGEGQDKQDKASKTSQDKQISDPPSARATQISRLGAEPSEGQASQVKPSKSQQANAKAQQGQEPANLPKSDHGAVAKRDSATANAGGLPRDARPPSVSNQTSNIRHQRSEAVPLADAIAWTNARAVLFGRAMYGVIHGRAAPPDLQAAHESDRADVGVWVHYWHEVVATSIPAGRYDEFEKRCLTDVRKKRKTRGIRNLGGLARKTIVPGIVAAMGGK